jgi:hypothetical protein
VTKRKKVSKKTDPLEGLVLFVCNECGRTAYADKNIYLACGYCSQRKYQSLQPMQQRWDAEFIFYDFVELSHSTIGTLGR